MKEPQIIEFNTKILDIRLINFIIAPLQATQIENLLRENITYEFNINVGLRIPENLVLLTLNTKFFESEKKEVLLGEMASSGTFHIPELKAASEQFGQIPNQLISTLAGVLVSTSRGFFLMKVENTHLQGAVIPIINPGAFFNKEEKLHEMPRPKSKAISVRKAKK